MELIVKRFDGLTADELYDILALRSAVFVVEQRCPYLDIDGADRRAIHVFFRDADGIQAYLRVLEAGVVSEEVSIGRVVAARRRCGEKITGGVWGGAGAAMAAYCRHEPHGASTCGAGAWA